MEPVQKEEPIIEAVVVEDKVKPESLGDVTITNSNAKQDKKIKRDTGDYVDFEEIK